MAFHSGAEPLSTCGKLPLNSASATRLESHSHRGAGMESDARFYRRRANEELAAAGRAVTSAARDRRMQLAGLFLQRLKASEARSVLVECEMAGTAMGTYDRAIFDWAEARISQSA